ncbi:MAG: hypothetical protein H8D96_08165 [Desulfobacterales bacterium]|uniref:Uncharacterized protein n=1 Tax=Candidatus Desulfatibia vada TaxID=2841696 RepID=A0A8J6P2A0_9BACT|nr:hypothetical protein [Candidatus Desulfatibia vada]
MEIEIVTTKRKLTKSIVNQMVRASLTETLINCKPLGFLVGVVENCPRAILIEHNGNYYTIPSNYTKGSFSVLRKIGRWHQSIKFDSEEACNEWWIAYKAVISEADRQIYI